MTKNLRGVYRPHDRVHPPTGETSRTMQEFREESNVNNIMAKYEQTKMLEHVNEHQGHYGDFISYDDYHTSLNKIYAAQEAFDSLPATVRLKFNNDPADFLNFVQDENNHDEMIDMGLKTGPKKNPSVPDEPSTPASEPEADPSP